MGYRCRTGVGGSLDTYRSVVNLGEGPKLFGLDLSFQSATRRWFDRIDVRANNWGGDPYNTAHVDATRHGWYNFNFDYRNIAYYNFLPSFADPTISRGFFLDQRSYDTRRRMSDFELELLPGRRIVPYLAYSHDAGSGSGITDFVSDVNEYPGRRPPARQDRQLPRRRAHRNVPVSRHARARRQHLQRRSAGFHERPELRQPDNAFLRRTVIPDQPDAGLRGARHQHLQQSTGRPRIRRPWIDLFGQFLYSRPDTDVHYAQYNTGQFVNLDSLLFFTSELDLLNATAKLPHTSGTFGFELRPMRRVRVIESFMTDRLHNASFASLTQNVIAPPLAPQIADFTDRAGSGTTTSNRSTCCST